MFSKNRWPTELRTTALPYHVAGPKNGLNWLRPVQTGRRAKYCLAALCFFSVACLFWSSDSVGRPRIELKSKTPQQSDLAVPSLPPLYEQFYELERQLPQHNESLLYPEGGDGEYFYAANHVWGLGFNNALQEALLLSHLAYIANRSFVFDPYTWHWNGDEPYSTYNGKLIPSRIPWGAILAGPTAGGTFDESDRAPRAVNKDYWRRVCAQPVTISSDVVNGPLPDASADVMMEAWSKKLRELPERCVEVDAYSKQIFDYMLFGTSSRLLPLLPSLIQSPIITRFAWSRVVTSAIALNAHLFTHTPNFLERIWTPTFNASDTYNHMSGLLAVHLRRGDYDAHCEALVGHRSLFMGWLQHPSIPDRFTSPQDVPEDVVRKYYMSHCWPSADEIVAKITDVQRTNKGARLRRVYMMTNAPLELVEELRNRLLKTGLWKDVRSSRDLVLTSEQKYIAQAIDMAIGMRAQVFIGNGFSSLSANVALLRLSRNHSPLSIRLW